MNRTGVLKAFVLFVGTVLLGGLLAACGHWAMRHEVAMKVSDDVAYICMYDGEVDIGDEVTIYATQCGLSSDDDGTYDCSASRLAEGVVTKRINEHYAEIVVTSGGPFKEGARVVKKAEFQEKFKALLKRIGIDPKSLRRPYYRNKLDG